MKKDGGREKWKNRGWKKVKVILHDGRGEMESGKEKGKGKVSDE